IGAVARGPYIGSEVGTFHVKKRAVIHYSPHLTSALQPREISGNGVVAFVEVAMVNTHGKRRSAERDNRSLIVRTVKPEPAYANITGTRAVGFYQGANAVGYDRGGNPSSNQVDRL